MDFGTSWLDKLREAQAEGAARNADRWRLPLERLHGKIGADGIERVTTQTVFDILEIPQRSRGAGAADRRGNRGTRFRALVLQGATCRSERHRGLEGLFN